MVIILIHIRQDKKETENEKILVLIHINNFIPFLFFENNKKNERNVLSNFLGYAKTKKVSFLFHFISPVLTHCFFFLRRHVFLCK